MLKAVAAILVIAGVVLCQNSTPDPNAKPSCPGETCCPPQAALKAFKEHASSHQQHHNHTHPSCHPPTFTKEDFVKACPILEDNATPSPKALPECPHRHHFTTTEATPTTAAGGK